MRFGKELLEPWGLLLALSAGGVAWAVQLPLLAAAGVGLAVLAARAGIATMTHGAGPSAGQRELPEVDPRSPQGQWLARARSAAREFGSLADSFPAGPLAEQVAGMRPTVTETVDTLQRLAGRAATTSNALARLDPADLNAEEQRLTHRRGSADASVHDELDKAVASVRSQQDVYRRLSGGRDKLLAQLESGTLGLESLVARLVELSATEDPAPSGGPDTLGELSDQLEGIRRGVVETEETTRRSLGG